MSRERKSRWDVKGTVDEDEELKSISRRLALEQGEGTEEIIINHCEPVVRYALTKRQTQEQIYKNTGATVITKGAYVPEEEIDAFSQPLYLLITGPCRCVDVACKLIKEIIDSGGKTDCLNPGLVTNVYVHLPGGTVDPKFNFIGKLLGPGGQYVKHITAKTQARVQVGATEALTDPTHPEKFHLQVTAPTKKGLEEAVALTNDLVTHVVSDYEEYLREKRKKAEEKKRQKQQPTPYPYPYPGSYYYQPPSSYHGYDPTNPGGSAPPPQPAYGYGGYGGYYGGYDPSAATGYDPNASTGYNPNASTGYDPNAATGYNPNASTGYDPSSATQSKNDDKSEKNGENGEGKKSKPAPPPPDDSKPAPPDNSEPAPPPPDDSKPAPPPPDDSKPSPPSSKRSHDELDMDGIPEPPPKKQRIE